MSCPPPVSPEEGFLFLDDVHLHPGLHLLIDLHQKAVRGQVVQMGLQGILPVRLGKDVPSEELRRKVTPEELSQETGLSGKAIRDAMRLSGFKIEDIETDSKA